MTTRRYDEFGLPIPPTFDDDEPAKPGWDMASRRRGAMRALVFLSALGAVGFLVLKTPLHKKAAGLVSEWLLDRAADKFMADDMQGALADLDRAVGWSAESPAVFALRAEVRLSVNDLKGSLADCNKLISLTADYEPSARARAYRRRAHVYQRLERHKDAIADATRDVELSGAWDATALNNRAYIRAIAKTELDEGLVDIEKALAMEENNAAFLDTRAYLLYRLKRYEAALADMERAIQQAETDTENQARFLAMPRVRQHRAAQRFLRLNRENLAVMYHHRGEIHGKLGNSAKADADLRRGDELGYNPANGVY